MESKEYKYNLNHKNIMDVDHGSKGVINADKILLAVHPLNNYDETRSCRKYSKEICGLYKKKNIPIVFILENELKGNIDFNPDYIVKLRAKTYIETEMGMYPESKNIGDCIKAKNISMIGGISDQCLTTIVENLVQYNYQTNRRDMTFTFYPQAIFMHSISLQSISHFKCNPPCCSNLEKSLTKRMNNLMEKCFAAAEGISYYINIDNTNILRHVSAYSKKPKITFNIKSSF